MIMYNALLVLFKVANIIAVVLLAISYVLTVVAKVRKSAVATSNILFPVFTEQHTMIKHCFWSGTLFIFLNWLLCSSSALPVDASSPNALSGELLTFGIVWAIMIFAGIITEIVIKCIKTSSSYTCSVTEGIKSTIWYTVLYFVLSFLIA